MKFLMILCVLFLVGCVATDSIDKLETVKGNTDTYISSCEIRYMADRIEFHCSNRFDNKEHERNSSYDKQRGEYYILLDDSENARSSELFLSVMRDTSYTIKERFGDKYVINIEKINDNKFKSSFKQVGKSKYHLTVYYDRSYKISEIHSLYRDHEFVYKSQRL